MDWQHILSSDELGVEVWATDLYLGYFGRFVKPGGEVDQAINLLSAMVEKTPFRAAALRGEQSAWRSLRPPGLKRSRMKPLDACAISCGSTPPTLRETRLPRSSTWPACYAIPAMSRPS